MAGRKDGLIKLVTRYACSCPHAVGAREAGASPVTVLSSSALRTASAISRFPRGFMRKALIPAACTRSGETVSLWPVQRMIGIAGFDFQQFRCKVNSRQIRHRVIRNDKIEFIGLFPEDIQCLSAARACNDLVAKPVSISADSAQPGYPRRLQSVCALFLLPRGRPL